MKAVGTGWARGVRWRDIELLDTEGGVPTLSLSGAAASHARELRGTRIHVSVGRSRSHALAFVLLEATET